MNYITDQLIHSLLAEELLQLNNEVVGSKGGTCIYVFNNDGVNKAFTSSAQLAGGLEKLKLAGVKEGNFFTVDSDLNVKATSFINLFNLTDSPIDFAQIEQALVEDPLLAKRYDIQIKDNA